MGSAQPWGRMAGAWLWVGVEGVGPVGVDPPQGPMALAASSPGPLPRAWGGPRPKSLPRLSIVVARPLPAASGEPIKNCLLGTKTLLSPRKLPGCGSCVSGVGREDQICLYSLL